MEKPNLEYINQLAAGNKEFEEKIILILKKELPQERQAYQEALAEKNTKFAADCVHKLKHKVSFLGLTEGYSVCEKYEESLKRNEFDRQDEFEEILNKIQSFIVNL
ncbi:MAG: Hpt domain-containing protein [Flavobacterium sp.]